jgi:recombination protein RecT
MNENAIEKAGERHATIKQLLTSDKLKQAVAEALPRHLTVDRFLRVALTALTKTPKLSQCTQESFFTSLLNLSQLGLEPDGRRAHLIPYGDQCQLIVDYKGLVELVMRSGNVSRIHADVVCENDGFEYDRGEIRAHRIDFRKPRGEVYAAYAVCKLKDGTEKAEVMAKDEIDKIKNRSRAGKAGPWVTDWNEMAKKTVFRRLAKWLPLSAEYRDALDADADVLDITPEVEIRKPKPIAVASDDLPFTPAEMPNDDRAYVARIEDQQNADFLAVCELCEIKPTTWRRLDDGKVAALANELRARLDEKGDGQ